MLAVCSAAFSVNPCLVLFAFPVFFVVKSFMFLGGAVGRVGDTNLRTAPKVPSVAGGPDHPWVCKAETTWFSRRQHTSISPRHHPFFVAQAATIASLP